MEAWYLTGTIAWLLLVGAWRLFVPKRPAPLFGNFHAWQILGAVGYYGFALWYPRGAGWLLLSALVFVGLAAPLDHAAGIVYPATYYTLETLLYMGATLLGVLSCVFLHILVPVPSTSTISSLN